MGVDFSPTFCYISYAVLGAHGGIAQLARAFGSYPECPRFKSRCRYQNRRSVPLRLLYGPLVKWLRHRPFTAVTWVRVPYGSPKESSLPKGGLLCFAIYCRDSNRAVSENVPVARFPREAARPQAVWPRSGGKTLSRGNLCAIMDRERKTGGYAVAR